ncbi:MAG: tetratricopeptide repeat protein [Verrucomicrobiota bacterium]
MIRKWSMVFILCLGTAWSQEAKKPPDPALDLYFGANGLYNRKLYPVAIQQYQQFLKKFPKHEKATSARIGLSLSLYAAGEYAEAIPILQKLAQDKKLPQQGEIQRMLAQSQLKTGKADAAEASFLAARKSAGDDDARLKAEAGLCESLYQQKKWVELIKYGEKIMASKGPLAERVRYQRGMAQFESKTYADAIKTLEPFAKVLKDSPFAHYGQFLLAESARHAADHPKAHKGYQQVVKGPPGPRSADAAYLLGFVSFTMDQHDLAIQELEGFVKANKDHSHVPKANLLLGRSYLEKKNYKHATQLLSQALTTPEQVEEATLWLGRAYARQELFKEAEEVLKKVQGKVENPRLAPILLFDLANAHFRQEAFKEAGEAYGKFLQQYKEHEQSAAAMKQRVYCLHRTGEHRACVTQCDAFIKQFAADEWAHEIAFLRAESLFLEGLKDEASKAFVGHVGQYPKSPRKNIARFRAGQIAYEQEDWKTSLALLAPLITEKVEEETLAQFKYLAGICAYQLEDWKQSAVWLEAFAKEQAKAVNVDLALLTAGLASEKAGDPGHAIEILGKVPLASAQSAQALVEAGRMRYDAEQYAEGRTSLQQVIQKHADSPFCAPAEYYLGWIESKSGKQALAAEHFGRMADQFTEHPFAEDARLQEGVNALAADQLPTAQAAFAAYLAKYPKSARADRVLVQLGGALIKSEQWAEAVKHLDRVIKQHKDSPFHGRALYDAAWAKKALEQDEAAIQIYTLLLSEHPDHELAQAAGLELAELEYESKAFDAAAKHLEKLLKTCKEPDLRERALYRLGWCTSDLGNASASAKAFEQLLSESPDSSLAASAAFQAGEARLQMKEFAPAYQHYVKAVAIERKATLTEQSLLRLGETQGLTERWAESEKTYTEFTKAFPSSELIRRVHFGLGWARENTRKYDRAIEAYLLVIAKGIKDVTEARCQFQVGECRMALKQYDEALAELVKVEVNYAYPEYSSKALLEMGNALVQKGNMEAAQSQFREVVEKYPESEAAKVAKTQIK